MSGFARKRFLEQNGFAVTKLRDNNNNCDVWAVTDAAQPDPAPIIASNRLQGVAVTEAIEALGGV